MSSLDDLRVKIDLIDDQILDLLLQREQLVKQVAAAKQCDSSLDTVYFRPEREAQIIRRLIERKNAAKSDFSDEMIYALFRQIITTSLAMESAFSVAYLGPKGTYTYEAAYRHFPQAEFSDQSTIEEVFSAVSTRQCKVGVVPIENSYEGAVHHTIDALVKHKNVIVQAEIVLPIRYCLLANAGDNIEDIHTVYAHEQALAQCRMCLGSLGLNLTYEAISSNARAAQQVAKEGTGFAALASENVAVLYGLQILQRNFADSDNNQTRFFVLGTVDTLPSGSDSTVLILTAHNKPGALLDILHPFSNQGISLNRIVSRPAPSGLWEYVFYLEVMGHSQEEPLRSVAAQLEENGNLVRVAGSYSRAP